MNLRVQHERDDAGGCLTVALPYATGDRVRSPLRDDPAMAAARFFRFATLDVACVQATPLPAGHALAVWYRGDAEHGVVVTHGLRRVLALMGLPFTPAPDDSGTA